MENETQLINKIIELVNDNDGDILLKNSHDANIFKDSLREFINNSKYSVYLKCNKIAELLINSGFNLYDDDGNYGTAFTYAIYNNSTEIAELLISKGCKLSAEYIEVAEQMGNEKISKLLKRIMYEPNSKIIQIVPMQNYNEILCEDGSIWEYRHKEKSSKQWTCILKATSDSQKVILDKRKNNLTIKK
jgi:ankyrin repeat protein